MIIKNTKAKRVLGTDINSILLISEDNKGEPKIIGANTIKRKINNPNVIQSAQCVTIPVSAYDTDLLVELKVLDKPYGPNNSTTPLSITLEVNKPKYKPPLKIYLL